MKKTKTQRIIEMLIKTGCSEVPYKSSKYRAFENSNNPGSYWFVGKRGALRHGKCVTKSISYTLYVPKMFLEFRV